MLHTANPPEWATLKEPARPGRPVYRVDTHRAYPAIIAALQQHYELAGLPDECYETVTDDEGEEHKVVKPQWQECYDALFAGNLDQYWLEVAYQCIKMEMQRCCGMTIEIHMKDPGKKYRQADHPEGRGAWYATHGKEAREHYRRLVGFVPS